MANHVIVGAGASGLYTAYRLLKDGNLPAGDTVQLYEWSKRPGGRIHTFEFPPDVAEDGLYCEFGGMRFATDPKFPAQTTEGHRLVQTMINELDLADKVVPFAGSHDRLYYLRGKHVYETDLTSVDALKELPYGFNEEFLTFVQQMKIDKGDFYTADNIISAIAAQYAGKLGMPNKDRPCWCHFFATGEVPADQATPSYPAGTAVRDIGYWNLLYDKLGDEGYDYAADANGYSSNVINWNAADAFENNNDVGSGTSYSRLAGGYSLLFEALASAILEMAKERGHSGIAYGHRLIGLSDCEDGTTTCTFVDDNGAPVTVEADQLFLAMPRRALEMVAPGCPTGYFLNDPKAKKYLEASIDQPSIKAVLVFDEAWWTSTECQYKPRLVWPYGTEAPSDTSQWQGGPTVTDLPLRMVDYFANNTPGREPGTEGGPYVLLASYDDMNYTSFWHEVETVGDYTVAPSEIRQPLTGPTRMAPDSAFASLLIKQLAEVHGMTIDQIPAPKAVYFQDWGQDPFGGGYHGWASHYDICSVMDGVRAPYQKILDDPSRKTYVIGSCYSFDQGWVEGALCVAESVLRDFVGLGPVHPDVADYKLVCLPTDAGLKCPPPDGEAAE